MLLFLTISWIMIHLGTNPVSGGRPPKERSVIRIVEVRRGEMFQVCDNVKVVVLLLMWSVRNIETVRMI